MFYHLCFEEKFGLFPERIKTLSAACLLYTSETKNSSVGFQYDDRRSMRRTRRKFRHGRFVYSDCSSTLVYNVSCGYAACVYNIVGYPSQRDKINKNGVRCV